MISEQTSRTSVLVQTWGWENAQKVVAFTPIKIHPWGKKSCVACGPGAQNTWPHQHEFLQWLRSPARSWLEPRETFDVTRPWLPIGSQVFTGCLRIRFVTAGVVSSWSLLTPQPPQFGVRRIISLLPITVAHFSLIIGTRSRLKVSCVYAYSDRRRSESKCTSFFFMLSIPSASRLHLMRNSFVTAPCESCNVRMTVVSSGSTQAVLLPPWSTTRTTSSFRSKSKYTRLEVSFLWARDCAMRRFRSSSCSIFCSWVSTRSIRPGFSRSWNGRY